MKFCFIVPGRPVKINLHKKNKQDTSFFIVNTKHKHMMKNSAPPDKVGVLYRLLPIWFHGFNGRTDF